MKNRIYNIAACLLVLLSAALLMGADSGDPGRDELAALRNRQSALRTRIEALKNEQNYLLFRRAMYHSDSKYLVLNVTTRTGRLMYRNRLLKDFRFRFSKNFRAVEMAALTKKSEDKKNRRAFVFGTSFLVHAKGTPVPRGMKDLVVVSITKKEMASIYYALEEGALVYLER